jgi:hypothetical protein
MIIHTPRGTRWQIDDAHRKLTLRAALPGAGVFDRAAAALRSARRAGISDVDRLMLALPASWLVNSPAISRVLRRWSVPPQREVWTAILGDLSDGPARWSDPAVRARVITHVRALGDEPYVVEAVSKVLALLAPDVAPLMPLAARAFALGDDAPADFGAMMDWFVEAVVAWREPLEAIAAAFDGAPLDAAQVLDRLLWFDSEGHKLFRA